MDRLPRKPSRLSPRPSARVFVFFVLGVFLCGCTAFNPAFLALFETSGQSSFQTLPNPPGHVVVGLVNQTEIDEGLLNFLKTRLELSDAQARDLRPRIRMRVLITYIDGTSLPVEFVNGSPNLIDPAFDTQAFPDLNQNDLDNSVVLCDVASVQLDPDSSIEVFLPVAVRQFQLVETTDQGGQVIATFQPRGEITPQFWPLEIDTVDEDGNVVLQQNVGVRDVPTPTPNVICGSIVMITVRGALAVPFLQAEGVPPVPSYDIDDEATEARIGGRYEFIVTVQ